MSFSQRGHDTSVGRFSLGGDFPLSGDAEACFTSSGRRRQAFRRIAELRSHLDFVAHPDRLPMLPGARAVGAFFRLEGSSGAPFEGRGISLAVSNCRLSLGGEGMSMIESSAFIVKFPLARSGDARASPFRTNLLDALLRPFRTCRYEGLAVTDGHSLRQGSPSLPMQTGRLPAPRPRSRVCAWVRRGEAGEGGRCQAKFAKTGQNRAPMAFRGDIPRRILRG